MIDFVPAHAIATAIGASFLIPVSLVLTGRTSLRPQLGSRYRLSLLVAWVAWGASLPLAPSWDFWDVLSGALVMAIATMISFNVWGLLAWGFMLAMLMALSRAGGPLTLKEWIVAHSGGDIDVFAANRVRVLLNMGLVEEKEGTIIVGAGRGALLARLGLLASAWYGVKR